MQEQDCLMQQSIPRNIEENPSLQDGLYDVVIRDISLQRSSRDTQIMLLFHLPDEQMHLVTSLRAPKRSYNRQDHRRLMDFCSAINVDIRHLLNTPAKVKGRRLRVKTKRSYYDADGTTHWYSDIVGFMSLGSEAERHGELGVAMVPHSGLAD
ncbi:MAG: hypothetical protein IIB58_13400 [Planctomycetes bacterium]|nr:hypothetical protein [Planctomycetota bacterium]